MWLRGAGNQPHFILHTIICHDHPHMRPIVSNLPSAFSALGLDLSISSRLCFTSRVPASTANAALHSPSPPPAPSLPTLISPSTPSHTPGTQVIPNLHPPLVQHYLRVLLFGDVSPTSTASLHAHYKIPPLAPVFPWFTLPAEHPLPTFPAEKLPLAPARMPNDRKPR